MLTTITTDGAGVILVTWKLDFNNFCKRYFLVANLQISQELSVYHFLNKSGTNNLSFFKLIRNYQSISFVSNLYHGQNFRHLPFTRSSIEKPVS